MSDIYLDTHVVVWLHAGQSDLLSHRARDLIESTDLVLSEIVSLELQFLFEIGRIRYDAMTIYRELSNSIGLRRESGISEAAMQKSLTVSYTRDPFDRILVAQALSSERSLVSRDRNIQKHCALAVW